MSLPHEKIGLKTKLWPHQREACRFAYRRSGTLLAHWMGGGKTLCVCALCQAWGARLVLVMAPLSVCRVWAREFQQHSAWDWNIEVLDSGGVRQKHDRAELAIDLAHTTGRPALIIVNHESVWRRPFSELAMRTPWDVAVLDESHRAKAPGGKFSQFVNHLAKRVPRRLACSGTPLPHSLLDAYAQGRFVDRDVFGTSFVRFKRRYAVLGGFEGREVVGFQRTDEFQKKFASLSHQVSRETAVADLPPEIDTIRETTLEPAAQRAYDQMDRDFWIQWEEGNITAANALVKLLRLQQVTSGFMEADDGSPVWLSEDKAKLLRDTLQDVEPPVVVFARFRSDLDIIHQAAATRGWTSAEISGRRKDALDSEGRMVDGVQVVACQIQAGGVGIDLTRASTGVVYSMGFSLGDWLQARARLHRPGQKRPVTHIHLVCRNTIDEKCLWALRHRREVIREIIERRTTGDGRADEVCGAGGAAAGS